MKSMTMETAAQTGVPTAAPQAERLESALNRQVANCMVLFMKLHCYHWLVSGQQFFTLHETFEQLYNEVKSMMDDLAERLLAIGGRPLTDLKACLQHASVQEAFGNESAQQMAASIASDCRLMAAELRASADLADRQGDRVTADMLTGFQQSWEKHAWMLEAFQK